MTNTNCLENIRCPDCGNEDRFRIAGTTVFTVTDEGTEDHGDIEWDDDSYAECTRCYSHGTLKEFMINAETPEATSPMPTVTNNKAALMAAAAKMAGALAYVAEMLSGFKPDFLANIGLGVALEETLAALDAAGPPPGPVIPAEAHTDDHAIMAKFDALPWFERASDREICDLADCGWGGDTPADYVAYSLEEDVPGLARLFAYLEIIASDPAKRDCRGFECRVDEDRALKWLKAHRPALCAELAGTDHE